MVIVIKSGPKSIFIKYQFDFASISYIDTSASPLMKIVKSRTSVEYKSRFYVKHKKVSIFFLPLGFSKPRSLVMV